jgi:hypothetical protein
MGSRGISAASERDLVRQLHNKPHKQMKISLKQRLRSWLLNDSPYPDQIYAVEKAYNAPSIDSDRSIRFTMHKASGGTIIETSFYDRQKDRHQSGLHVITDDKDISKELGKIITMETLKV